MQTLLKLLMVFFPLTLGASAAEVHGNFVDIGVNTEKRVTTVQGLVGLPASLGPVGEYQAVLRLAPLVAGRKYEATLTFNAEPEHTIHYRHAWVDGDPFGKDWSSLVGMATGTGTREPKKDKQEKFLFTIDAKSTSGTLYIPLSSSKPFTFRFRLSDKLTGVHSNSRDHWGETFVNDFDANRVAPFLLKRGAVSINGGSEPEGAFVNIGVNTEKTVTTVQGLVGLPASLGPAGEYQAILRLAPLVAGRKYEVTITFNAEPEHTIHYRHAWLDGNPYGKDWHSFVGMATGTGTREPKRGKQEKFLFTIDAKSTSGTLYIPLNSSKPFTFRFGLSDKLTGVHSNSQDRWGETFVKDFDANRIAPFLLKR